MTNKERRKYKRKDTLNLLDFVILDENGGTVDQAMGRTLNASESGILLETTIPLKTDQIIVLTIGIEENLVDLQGQVVYTKEVGNLFQSGINFLKIDKHGLVILREYLAALQEVLDSQL